MEKFCHVARTWEPVLVVETRRAVTYKPMQHGSVGLALCAKRCMCKVCHVPESQRWHREWTWRQRACLFVLRQKPIPLTARAGLSRSPLAQARPVAKLLESASPNRRRPWKPTLTGLARTEVLASRPGSAGSHNVGSFHWECVGSATDAVSSADVETQSARARRQPCRSGAQQLGPKSALQPL